jgi:hypothetical protein
MAIGPEARERAMSAQASRETESRENTTRAKLWQPASTLPDPNPQEGWSFRWIRTDYLGQSDPGNVDRQMREGWIACLASEHPEIHLGWGTAPGETNIRVGGLMLCKRPMETTVSHRQALQQKTAQQITSAPGQHLENASNTNMRFDAPKQEITATTGPRRDLAFRP